MSPDRRLMTMRSAPPTHSVLRAVMVFTVFMVLFYGLVHTRENGETGFEPYLKLIASVTGSLLDAIGYDVTVSDRLVSSSQFSFRIARGCDAIEPTAVFVSAVFASPTTIWPKVAGVLVGTAILFLMNFARLLGLFYIGVHFPAEFDFIHEDIGQFAFVVFAVLCWTIWGLWARRQTLRHTNGYG